MSSEKTNEVADWVHDLSEIRLPRVFNPWGERNDLDREDDGPGARRHRLKTHVDIEDAKLVLVAEALGYNGGRFSGCAMTSERLLLEGAIPRLENMSQKRITTRKIPFSEPTATIVWKCLFEHQIAERTVLWNAFPFHPMGDSELSNRAPTKEELQVGLPLLETLLRIHSDAEVVAIGRKAESSMALLGIECKTARHPSMGGAPAFRSAIRSIMAS